ncbi:eukaryotic translation initiation factor 2-alpha kinase 4 isoform 1 [Planoprotostelium fungivorum]|uniref:non-specific serine/threonine protein kinase n=1 Tax=Planoprotostelium fungivorum TaxID=1890364 RepID=A0A2P6NG45_9EUKA|nr:eukaryotic translation initiation factor 2-alpha kinase 4 isoform 1 [Planoprotostelium fungivorum]
MASVEQSEELLALQAIFEDNFREDEPGTHWSNVPSYRIRLVPKSFGDSLSGNQYHQQTDGSDENNSRGINYCAVDLHIRFSPGYPQVPPNLKIEKVRGLSNESLSELQNMVNKRIVELTGQVMIWDIANHIQEYLIERNNQPMSFYDKMVKRQQEQNKTNPVGHVEDKKKEDKGDVELRGRIETEMERQKSMGITLEEEEYSSEEEEGNAEVDYKPVDFKLGSSTDLSIPTPLPSSTIRWNRLQDLGLGTMGCTYSAKNIDNGKRMVVKEISYSTSTPDVKEKVLSVIHHIDLVRKMEKQPNLVPILGTEMEESDGNVILRIFSEHITGGCISILMKTGVFSEPVLGKYAIQILTALQHLHVHGLAHGDLKISNILLDPEAGYVRLTDYSIMRMLQDVQNAQPTKTIQYWTTTYRPSESDPNVEFDQKMDIADLGKCLIYLSGGKTTIPNGLSHMARDFIEACLRKEDSASELLQHRFVRDLSMADRDLIPLSPAPTPPPSIRRSDHTTRTDDDLDPTEVMFESSDGFIEPRVTSSRYRNDFEELAELGSGGFGVVVKARNKLDERYYAIKKVRLNARDQSLPKMVREVTTLSRLNHQYVVRYFQAWIEGNEEMDEEEYTASSDEEDWFSSRGGNNSRRGTNRNQFSLLGEETNNSILFESQMGGNLDDEDDFETSPMTTSVHSPGRERRTILYIQMEYCTKHTLRQVEGLNHVHSQGIIHRDEDGNVKIGDFGLATEETRGIPLRSSMEFPPNLSGHHEITSGVGTPFYTSPEQESRREYDQKVDVYSLGIIFFEMCYSFSTGMERVLTLNALRNTLTFPRNFEKNHTHEAEVIKLLLATEPTERPTAHQFLNSGHLPSVVEEELLKNAMKSITNANTTLHSTVVDLLFSVKPDKHSDHHYDYHMGTAFAATDCSLRETIIEQLVKVCKRHGAMNVQTPVLIPKNDIQSQNHVAMLMDDTGTLLSLSYDLTLPFARLVARNRITNLRRYHHARVFRKHGAGKPKELHELDFDIISPVTPSMSATMVNDAEVIKTVVQMIDSLNLHWNLGRCSIRYDKMPAVRTAMSTFVRHPWSHTSAKLIQQGIITREVSDALDFYFTLISTLPGLSNALTTLEQVMKKSKGGKDPLMEIKYLIKHLQTFDVADRIKLDLGFLFNYKYYSGVVFQVALEQDDTIVAAGGRYDKLLLEFSPAKQPSECTAVGVNVAIEKLITSVNTAISQASKSDKKYGRTTDTQVFVCSVGHSLLEERMKIASELWAVDVAAEYNHSEKISIEEMVQQCRSTGIPWLVIIRDRAMNSVRIRSVDGRGEVTVLRSDITSTIVHAIHHNELLQPQMETLPNTNRTSTTTTSREGATVVEVKGTPPRANQSGGNSGHSNGNQTKVAPTPSPMLDVIFVAPLDVASKLKRKISRLALTKVEPMFQVKYFSNVKILAVDLPLNILKDVALTWESKTDTISAVTVLTRYPRYKDKIQPLATWLGKNGKTLPVIALYSIKDDDFTVMFQKSPGV